VSVSGSRPWGSLLSGWDRLRESYWFLPMMMVSLAAGLAVGLIEVDDHLADWETRRLPWIQDTGAEGTRALLSTVAGSMITVTGVVFSITIVALTLASSQFGPRLLRNFLRDRANQLVLGTFVATFLYSLLVLRAVEVDRVPYVATAVALALAVASVFVLIYFVHHSATSIQASSVIAAVAREIENELPGLFPEELGREPEQEAEARVPQSRPGEAVKVWASRSGYVRLLTGDALFSLAVERDLMIELAVRPGDFVAEGQLLAWIAPAERSSPELEAEVRESFVFGSHRTAVQDLGFLTDQLAEMAVRALSPGTNDPRTAVACIHRLGVVMATVARRKMPSPERLDDDGELRIVAPATTFAGVVASCLDPIRRYGLKDAEVVEAALRAIAAAAERCPLASRRALLLEHAEEWAEGFARGNEPSKRDRKRVEEAARRVLEAATRIGLASA